MNHTSIGICYSSNPMHISEAPHINPRPAYVTALRCQIITPISFLLHVRLSVCPLDKTFPSAEQVETRASWKNQRCTNPNPNPNLPAVVLTENS